MRKIKSNKNQFRCVICDILKKEDSDLYIPFYLDGEIVHGKTCCRCYSENIQKIAVINNMLYLVRVETVETINKSKKTKPRTKKNKSSD